MKISLKEEGSSKSCEIRKLTDRQWITLRSGGDVTIRQRGYGGYRYFILICARGNVHWSPCGHIGESSGRWEEA